MTFVACGELRELTLPPTIRKAPWIKRNLRVALEDFPSSVVSKAGSIIAI